MPEGEDWLWAPVEQGMADYRHVIDGTLDLADIAKMNDILAVRNENQRRADASARAKAERDRESKARSR